MAREEYDMRQKYKARRRRLWHIIREHYRIGAKWGLDPIPHQYHLQTVLLMEQIIFEEELFNRISVNQQKS